MQKVDFTLKTPREGFINITAQVQETIRKDGTCDGVAIVYCPHTTAAITINENADPDVVSDLLLGLDTAFFTHTAFRHAEGNSAAHLKASVMGSSVTVIVDGGRLVLGTWQGIYFCEFDGPRNRRFHVKVIGDNEQ
ncbi:MAG: secondary thiamine-phosphate synthase enzyme YjbQ [Coriobacteriales bacterium]|jgi:secondary thiamine-phosphate synthase enzyme|nr:secondary thiamine-phosphate synthase enzyme YjbQ [Coriobacteriales bacterium]